MKKVALILITILSCIGCDQTTKAGAQSLLQGQAPTSFLGGTLNFIYAENTGGMLSLGGNLPDSLRFALLVVFAGIVLAVALAYLIFTPLHKLSVVGLSLLIGGGLSNVWDRIYNDGAVVDFILIKLGPVQTGIFNVADMAIFAGAFLLWYSFEKLESGGT